MQELYKMLLSDRAHESKLFWIIFGVMNVVNGGLFVFVTENKDHPLIWVASSLGIALCIVWGFAQRRIRGWVRWWEIKLEQVEPLYFEELNHILKRRGLTTLPAGFTLFRNRLCAVREGISTRLVGVLIPIIFALAWVIVLLWSIGISITIGIGR